MKVKDMPYSRADVKSVLEYIANATQQVRQAKSLEELLAIRKDYQTVMDELYTKVVLTSIRFTCNTKDEFYSAEQDYYDASLPAVSVAERAYVEAIMQSPWAKEYCEAIAPTLEATYRNTLASTDERVLAEMEEENRLTTKYSRFMAGLLFPFQGKDIPLTVLRKYLADDDRAVRKQAHEVLGTVLKENAAELDGIFDELVKVRDRMAKKLGYKNFVELGYRRMNRICYDAQKVERFRKSVREGVVPVVTALKEQLAKDLGIECIRVYDDGIYAQGGNPKPATDRDGILAAAQTMYRDMSAETGEFFDFMLATDALDVDAREGKAGGGYCTEIASYKQPFIFANFNGSSGDVDVVTHEIGHALNAWYGFRQELPREVGCGGMETAETHSMSMEFFAWKYMERFFEGKADKYRLMHLTDSMCFIPYGTIVDAFQHEVYENPEWTPEDRKACWRKLEATYRPYLHCEGVPYLEEGTRWQYQSHIFESPFYYIDYCLAQTVAFQFLLATQTDYDGAFCRYIDHVKRSGYYDFETLLQKAGLRSPFTDGALGEIYQELFALQRKLHDGQ